jgi:hypothetical protein
MLNVDFVYLLKKLSNALFVFLLVKNYETHLTSCDERRNKPLIEVVNYLKKQA